MHSGNSLSSMGLTCKDVFSAAMSTLEDTFEDSLSSPGCHAISLTIED